MCGCAVPSRGCPEGRRSTWGRDLPGRGPGRRLVSHVAREGSRAEDDSLKGSRPSARYRAMVVVEVSQPGCGDAGDRRWAGCVAVVVPDGRFRGGGDSQVVAGDALAGLRGGGNLRGSKALPVTSRPTPGVASTGRYRRRQNPSLRRHRCRGEPFALAQGHRMWKPNVSGGPRPSGMLSARSRGRCALSCKRFRPSSRS